MKSLGMLIVFQFIIGCAAGLDQLEKSTDLSKAENATFIYGYSKGGGYTHFEIRLKNEADGKYYSYSKNWMGIPFTEKEILYAFPVKPGNWKLESVIFSKGGQSVVPMQLERGFALSADTGYYLGNFTSTNNPFGSRTNPVETINEKSDKQSVDSLMAEEYSSFDPKKTKAIQFQSK